MTSHQNNDTRPLYQRHRPKTWDEVVGLEEAKHALMGAINARRRGPFLMHGPSGTGKTLLAEIFSRAWVCENRVGANPCNVCESCLDAGKEPLYFVRGAVVVRMTVPEDEPVKVVEAIHTDPRGSVLL